ncbi:uncharacterized protein LOC143493194 [Brachyhypopomus gauderio]|uniref:uncharacterized protein LOC143493194 n=1 Tax=Brachyhypopomus gauderio TaxID=698409 RepID=UPI00404359C1
MKRGRRKGGSKDKVFGCDLLEHLASTNQEIPHVLRSCSEFIEEHGIVDGIYRLSGVSSNTQKLRSEFDIEGTPDLNKDVYLQDIHCVSSLCKAYFRELPNPLLTYQLYDRFAEAVAVQLENERLVKIREVLSDLPSLHYRTLQYLMRHLVRMAKHASETNMHARNLAIVWAPNLLRSKDIEASGFNGTAAFMEVRVQSIVVEFILTHVAQLFPESDSQLEVTAERRKSLPSPSALSTQDDQFFKALPFVQYPGNMSPGDGPPPMRPYHAIIDGTDKRKGSLKGRKWMSIFNLGGRLQDPRKKSKYTTKEKEKTALRPAKSMDSLSPGPYTQEDSQHLSPHNTSVATPPGNTEGGASGVGGMSSGYAVTYRRTGGASVSMVSGGGGTQGTYKPLEARAASSTDKPQAALHGMTSKAERRAGMHISGPFSVTVPLHITSGLALGLLHKGRAEAEPCPQDAAEEKDVKDAKQEDAGEKEGYTEKVKERTEEEMDIAEGDDTKEEGQTDDKEDPEEGPEKTTEQREERDEEVAGCGDGEDSQDKDEEDDGLSKEDESSDEQQAACKACFTEFSIEGEYMDMRPVVHQDPVTVTLSHEEECTDLDLPLDFQDTFGFLDLMDTSGPSQLIEFSVEPPGYEEYEQEDEEEEEADRWRNTTANTHLPLPGKSHSLPYKSCNLLQPLSFSSDDDGYSGPDDDDDNEEDSDKSEYEDMFCKSLPSAQQFQGLNWVCQPVTLNTTDTSVDSHSNNQTECLNHTYTIEVPEGTKYSPPVTDSESLTHTDIEMAAKLAADNEMDVNATDQCLNQVDLSQLPLESDHSSLEKKDTNTSDAEESDSEGAEHVSESLEELEKNENYEDTNVCSYNEVECHSEASEDEEDTYFGPDATSTPPEPSNIETSYLSDLHLVIEEHANSDVQQDCSEGALNIALSEVIVTDEPITEPFATDSVSLANQDEAKITELPVEQNVTLHSDTQSSGDGETLGAEPIDRREDGEKGQGEKDKISVTRMDVGNEVDKEEKASTEEENDCMTSDEIKEEPEMMTVTHLKDEEESEEALDGVKDEGTAGKNEMEVDELGAERQIIPEREGVEETSVKEGKERRGSQTGDNRGLAEDDIAEETETVKKDIAIIKDVSVAGGGVVRELSEDEDSVSEEDGHGSSDVAIRTHTEKQQSDGEKDKTQAQENDAVLCESEPLRPPRMKESEGGGDVDLGPGAGSTVLKSKPCAFKVYQVKAVPVVPPKPQYCKLTAFRQQLQQRDTEKQHVRTRPADGERQCADGAARVRGAARRVRRDDGKEGGAESQCGNQDGEHGGTEKGDEGLRHDRRGRERRNRGDGERLEENAAGRVKKQPDDTETCRSSGGEPGKGGQEAGQEAGQEEYREDRRRLAVDGRGARKDKPKESDREVKRASGISMCFDEAVARATGKRCREKGSVEKEKFVDLQVERGDQKESPTPKKREEEGKTD